MSGDADSGGLVGGGDRKVEGSGETVVPSWQVNVGRAPGRQLLVTGACRQKQAWSFQFCVGDGSLVVAELKNFIPYFVVSHGSVTACGTLAAMVATVVEDGVAQGAKFG